MKSLLGPFVLRRLKQEVAGQLTEKTHATGAPRVAAGGVRTADICDAACCLLDEAVARCVQYPCVLAA